MTLPPGNFCLNIRDITFFYSSDDTVALVKAVNTGFARLSQEVFQNVQKINAFNKDQANLLQEMLQNTIKGFNERIYTLSEAHFNQQQECLSNCHKRTAVEVSRALSTEANLPLAESLSRKINEMKKSLEDFEVVYGLVCIKIL